MKTASTRGWHPEVIKAAIRMRGYTFNRIGRETGQAHPRQASEVLRRKWPAMEQRVGEIVGVHPKRIWPTRYQADGSPKGIGIRRRYHNAAQTRNGTAA